MAGRIADNPQGVSLHDEATGEGFGVGYPLPVTDSTGAANGILIGAVNETAPATDTASSGLNGRLQRIAQRLTTLITAIGTLVFGAGTAAAAQRVTLASDDPAVATLGATTGTKVITDANGTIQQYLRGIVSQWATYLAAFPAALGQGTMAQSLRVVLPSDQTVLPVSAARGAVALGTHVITDGSYAATENVGPLIEIDFGVGLANKVVNPGVLIIATLYANVTTALAAYTYVFEGNPSASTTADGSVFVLHANDVAKVARMSLNGLTEHTAATPSIRYWTVTLPTRITLDSNGKFYVNMVASGATAITAATSLKTRCEITW